MVIGKKVSTLTFVGEVNLICESAEWVGRQEIVICKSFCKLLSIFYKPCYAGLILFLGNRRHIMLLDSGARREFGTGAVRDIAEGKGRCDLLPLGIIADRLNDRVFTFIEEYIRLGDPASLWFALDEFIGKDDKQWYSTLLDISKHYEAGCAKYGDRNWEKGIPCHCYIDSGVRHYIKFRRGDTDENHHLAFIWNLMCCIWTHVNKPHMIDLPFAEKQNV